MENTVQLTIWPLEAEEQDILVAHLAVLGFEGFEQVPGKLVACISESSYDASQVQQFVPPTKHMDCQVISPRNWNEEWENGFQPVVVDDFCAIRASFHQPMKGIEHELVITPKMSFGTGHHATTFQVIRMMKDINFEGKEVLDFGTGTGVLAILAEKLGASRVIAIDIDEWSISNCRENLQTNQAVKVELELSGKLPEGNFDIILANINKHVILDNMEGMTHQIKIGGLLVLSGLLEVDLAEVRNAAENLGMTLVKKSSKDNWLALKFKR